MGVQILQRGTFYFEQTNSEVFGLGVQILGPGGTILGGSIFFMADYVATESPEQIKAHEGPPGYQAKRGQATVHERLSGY